MAGSSISSQSLNISSPSVPRILLTVTLLWSSHQLMLFMCMLLVWPELQACVIEPGGHSLCIATLPVNASQVATPLNLHLPPGHGNRTVLQPYQFQDPSLMPILSLDAQVWLILTPFQDSPSTMLPHKCHTAPNLEQHTIIHNMNRIGIFISCTVGSKVVKMI